MIKKLILSSVLVITLFSFNNEVHAEESAKTNVTVSESDILLSSYVNSEDLSSDILNTTYLKSELMELDSGLMKELIEDLIAIEEPSESDSKVMFNVLQALNNAAENDLNGTSYYTKPEGLDTLKEKFEQSNYPKEVIKKGSIEFKGALDTFEEEAYNNKMFDYSMIIGFFTLFVFFVVLIIILPTNSSDTTNKK